MNRKVRFRIAYCAVLAAFCVTGAFLLHKEAGLRRADEFYMSLRTAGAPKIPAAALPKPEESPLPELCSQLAELAEDCPEAAAWLQLPGTVVDYPVMLGSDNAWYLNRLPDGSHSAAGSLFLDFRCGGESRNLVIYGHNMSQSMFGTLRRFRDENYFAEHSEFTLATESAEYTCRIFAVRLADAYGDAYTLDFADEEAFLAYCAEAREESLYDAGAEPRAGDVLVTLSTCTGGLKSERLLVQAVLNRE